MGLHGLDVAHDVITRVRQLDNKGTVLLMARSIWVGLGHDHGDVGNAGGRAKPFLTIQHPLVAVEYGGRLHTGGVCTGSFFGHGIADTLFTVEQRF